MRTCLVVPIMFVLSFRINNANSELEVTRGSFSPRIVGGRTATPHAYPYQALFYAHNTDSSFFLCSGSLISSDWVLTAAHCVEGVSYVIVKLGVHNMSANERSQITYNSSSFIIHEGWDDMLLINDIALIKLPSPATLNENVSTIKVASGNETYEADIARVTGWGLTANGALSSVLKYADVRIMNNKECATFELYRGTIVASHICTSGVGSIGACNGDSGGPLVFSGVQIGIVSFGYSSCTKSKPSVYTRLTEFADWIKAKTHISTNPANGSSRKVLPVEFLIMATVSLIYGLNK